MIFWIHIDGELGVLVSSATSAVHGEGPQSPSPAISEFATLRIPLMCLGAECNPMQFVRKNVPPSLRPNVENPYMKF